MKISEAIRRLQQRADENPELEIAYNGIWTEEDVFGRAAQNEEPVDLEQARNCISWIDDQFDANDGINWDTIDYALKDD